MTTSRQILKLLEDFSPSSYPIGNVSNYTYFNRDKIVDLINNQPEFAEKALLALLKTDYSYYIAGQLNPFFIQVKQTVDSGQSLNKQDSDKLKQILVKNYIDLLVQVVNFNNLYQ